MKATLLLASGILLLAACNNSDEHAGHRTDGFSEVAKTPEDSLFKLVMEGHDIGMAKMGKIKEAQKLAQAALDSLNKTTGTGKEALQQALMDVQEDLNYAEYSMNTWMEEFNVDSARDNQEVRLTYLKSEQEKVDKVKGAILESLRVADSLFKK
ncbi:hypothetical protein [Flavihumibacter sp. CACIAM 22H1]|uniref:hypothetical protein n=1 Tax=Flavihumibacter sp. CACIAM 22H1 TaxID=1812911 RepID=UPI0007A89D6E|nr:hypothetical protein [Flavihumibacter sp. CACIAM 22H1]KYP15388.1 MAG: hypothetical protein A1D16_16525 [Flavihumibacter sp. CACIAM 22H1]